MKSIQFPKFSQWKKIPKILHKKEKITFLVFLGLALASLIFLTTSLYLKNTKVVAASGGSYTEGVIGQPRFINPIYGETNDVDRDLIELVFSGLMSYDDNGNIVNDLVDSYKVSEDGKTYEFKLKDKILWQDGQPLTSEDVVFTIRTIQNSDYKSPLRANWLDVDTEIISENSFRLKLKSPYNAFLENCTLKIIPKHIWENILPENFALSFYNLQPVGSGPYKFKSLKQADTGFISSISLKANTNYYKSRPYISNIDFKFFERKEDLIKAANKKDIDGYSSVFLTESPIQKSFSAKAFSTPRYFAVFFNTQQSEIFNSIKVRQALNYATDKKALIDELESGLQSKYGVKTLNQADSPILPAFEGYNEPTTIYGFDAEKAGQLLDSAGFKADEQGQRTKNIAKTPAFQFKSTLSTGSSNGEVTELQKCLAKDPEIYQGDATGYFGKATKEAVTKFQAKYLPDLATKDIGIVGKSTRAKLNELCTPPAQNTLPLAFDIVTINQPLIVQAANILKAQWEKMGIQVTVKTLSIQDLKIVIKNRDYDCLLYGEALGTLIDPYPFWHSSQKIDPGLNLSGYDSQDADKLLKDARESLDDAEKQQKYEEFQNILIADAPAIFLYNSSYVYIISNKIQGIDVQKIVDPAKRFATVEEWHVKTKRVFK